MSRRLLPSSQKAESEVGWKWWFSSPYSPTFSPLQTNSKNFRCWELWWPVAFTAFLQMRPMSPCCQLLHSPETLSSVPLLYPLSPNLPCFRILLRIGSRGSLSCFRAPCKGQLLALIWDLVHLLSGARLQQTHVSSVGCSPGSCRTAWGSQCDPKPLPFPCSVPWCDARPWSCPLAEKRDSDKDGTEGGGRRANRERERWHIQSRVGSFVKRHSWHQ